MRMGMPPADDLAEAISQRYGPGVTQLIKGQSSDIWNWTSPPRDLPGKSPATLAGMSTGSRFRVGRSGRTASAVYRSRPTDRLFPGVRPPNRLGGGLGGARFDEIFAPLRRRACNRAATWDRYVSLAERNHKCRARARGRTDGTDEVARRFSRADCRADYPRARGRTGNASFHGPTVGHLCRD
jgi:hypothetical protein